MRKGVANVCRYRDVSMAANRRYLDALAVVDDPTPTIRDLDKITERTANGKKVSRGPTSDRRAFIASMSRRITRISRSSSR